MTGVATRSLGADVASGRRPRLGFLGTGWIGRHRLAAASEGGAAEVAAICDPDPAARAQAIGLAPGARVVASSADLLALDLDGVVIATPSAAHAEQSIAALDRGLAVFCQKPLARDAAEAAAVVTAARRADRLLDVDLCYRHLAGVDEIRRRLRDGELGTVFAADLVFHNAYGPDKPWFTDARLSGGGCVIDLGVHLVDLVLWLLDFPEVRAVTSRLHRDGEVVHGRGARVEDHAEVRLDLAGGATVRLACSWFLSAGRDAVIHAALHGTRGGALLENVDGSFFDFRVSHLRGPQVERLAEPPDPWGGRAIRAWTRRLRERGGRYDPAIERHLAVCRVLDAIYDAAREAPS